VGLPVHPDEFAGHLARVHSAVRRLPPAAVDIARSVAAPPRESSRQPVDVEFMSCTILDLKQGHCGRRVARSGPLVQLDLESLTFGADPLLDVAEEPAGTPAAPGDAVNVTSTHKASWGETLAAFSITWTHGRALTTEYNAGLSIFHDIKDHRLYGLGPSSER
jgi:hypothetical protein